MTTFVKTVDSNAAGIQTILATSRSSHQSSASVYFIVCLLPSWFYFQSCNYKRIVELLLRAALVHHDDFIQRTAIALCNLLVCQVCSARNLILWYVQTWEQWGPSGETLALHQGGVGLSLDVNKGRLSLLFSLFSAFRGFSPVFPSPLKPTVHKNSILSGNCLQLVQIREPQVY